MPAVTGTLTIESGEYQSTSYFVKRNYAGAIMLYVPSGVSGIIAVRVSDQPGSTGQRCYNSSGQLLQINPSSLTLPAWVAVDADVFAAHYIWLETYTTTAETTPQTQSADVEFRIMGIYSE